MRLSVVLSGLVTAIVVLAADQGSKWWVLHGLHLPEIGQVVILPVLNFTMVWNRGVTFGLLTGNSNFAHLALAVFALAVVIVLAIWLTRTQRLIIALPVGAIAGGALGNVADRLHYGAVVDFIQAHAFGYSWYVFNVADAAIVCGVAALVIDNLLPGRSDATASGAKNRG
ncbi:signal peptidase II [Acidisoma silvae]|uniref:Lipoprotein signal peptidase n=1 Tax=Acidisoma silvae TaxID=2802396 RepID=A0A963YMP8_9PROT|nr:signal peptidase II [Acidisoma silvae]MCB8873565.1 signal peptidase II [Acidisoma silvae]